MSIATKSAFTARLFAAVLLIHGNNDKTTLEKNVDAKKRAAEGESLIQWIKLYGFSWH